MLLSREVQNAHWVIDAAIVAATPSKGKNIGERTFV